MLDSGAECGPPPPPAYSTDPASAFYAEAAEVYQAVRDLTEEQQAIVTPPFPEYTSGHSVQSAAVAQVLTDLFGAAYAFTDRTREGRGLAARPFASFDAFAKEAAISWLYGGIHYRAAIEAGLARSRPVFTPHSPICLAAQPASAGRFNGVRRPRPSRSRGT